MGLAIGQTITQTTSPLAIIKARNGEPSWPELEMFVKQWKPDAFVIGMPFNMDGTENKMTAKAESFINKLSERFDLNCYKMDERLSTREARAIRRTNAEEAGKKFDDRADVDSLAAQLILESWLNENC